MFVRLPTLPELHSCFPSPHDRIQINPRLSFPLRPVFWCNRIRMLTHLGYVWSDRQLTSTVMVVPGCDGPLFDYTEVSHLFWVNIGPCMACGGLCSSSPVDCSSVPTISNNQGSTFQIRHFGSPSQGPLFLLPAFRITSHKSFLVKLGSLPLNTDDPVIFCQDRTKMYLPLGPP